MKPCKPLGAGLLSCLLLLMVVSLAAPSALAGGPVKVFILAGQSNGEGKAKVELLPRQIKVPGTRERLQSFQQRGAWIKRDEVPIKFLDRKGKLTAGFGCPGRTGPEGEFRHAVGDRQLHPVLLSEAAWGGKSLFRDFGLPTAGLPADELLQQDIERAQKQKPETRLERIKESYGALGSAKTYSAIGGDLARAVIKLNEGGGADSQDAEAAAPDPLVRNIEGWTVHVERALVEGQHAREGGEALAMLANHLQRIKILVPQPQLAQLQTVEIWIEYEHPQLQAMQYHPSKRWLIEHGHDPRLAKKVHITRASSLTSRQQMLKHPAVVLHELAHAYHDQFLGFDHPEIIAAYEQAKEAGIYEQVLLYTGNVVRHYGLTNAKEYFAEGTEAYFYRNDFYPFVRAELRKHDPTLHDLLVKIWETPERSAGTESD